MSEASGCDSSGAGVGMSDEICETACQYALDVGMPEYSGMRGKPNGCGNCAHYREDEEPCLCATGFTCLARTHE